MSLQDRVTNILLRPQEEWTVIAGERSRMSELYLSYVAPLAAIGPLASVVGLSVIGYGNPVTGHYRVAFGNSITQAVVTRSEEHTSELQSQSNLVCRLLLEKKKRYRTKSRGES